MRREGKGGQGERMEGKGEGKESGNILKYVTEYPTTARGYSQ